MDQEALTAFYDQMSTFTGGAMTFSPVGSATMTMGADGSYSWKPDATITSSSSGIDIVVTLGGSMSGSYTVAGDTISSGTTDVNDLTVSATAGGVEMDPAAIGEAITTSPLSNATFVCSAHELTTTTSNEELTLVSTFTR